MWNDWKIEARETIVLALPVIVGQLGQVMMGNIDIMMLGKLGEQAISASSLAGGIFILIAVIGFGVMGAISPLISKAKAENDILMCKKLLHQSIWIAFALGILLMMINYWVIYMLPYLNQPPEDTRLATQFLSIFNLSMIPLLLFMGMRSFSDGVSDTRPAMVITFIGLALNIVLNYLLIEGNMGFPRMEIRGSAYATLITRVFMVVLMAGWLYANPKYKAYDLTSPRLLYCLSTIKKILSVGLPSGFQYFFEIGAFAGASVMLGWMGEHATDYRAAHQIAISIAAITYMMAAGISTASSIRVGDALGRRNLQDIRKSGFTGLYISLAFMLLSAIIFILFSDYLPLIYQIKSPFVLKTASELLVIGAFFQLFDGAQVVGLGILRGIQDVKYPTIMTFITYWLICMPLLYIFGFLWHWNVQGAWYAFVISLMLAAVFNNGRFYYLTKDENFNFDKK